MKGYEAVLFACPVVHIKFRQTWQRAKGLFEILTVFLQITLRIE